MNNSQIFVETFTTEMLNQMGVHIDPRTGASTVDPRHEERRNQLIGGLYTLFQPKPSLQRTQQLDARIIHAVTNYSTPEDQQVLLNWLKVTPNKNTVLDEDGNTILHLVAKSGRSQLIPFLIKHGLSINLENNLKSTPLYLTVVSLMNTDNPKQQTRLKDTINAFIANGAKNRCGNTPLSKSVMSLAASSGNLELVQLLHQSGFDLNEGDIASPLFFAKNSKHKNPALIRYMQENGAVELEAGARATAAGFKP